METKSISFWGISLSSTLLIMSLSSCAKKEEEQLTSLSGASRLYVATGSCNSGTGITTHTTTATRTIEEFSLQTGTHNSTVLDYNASGTFVAATHPRSIVDNGDSLYILNENGTTTSERKVISVPKSDPLSFSTYYANPTVLSGAAIRLYQDDEGSLLISKSTAIEKISSSPIRLPAGANPWVSAPGGTCATSTTNISNVLSLPKFSGTTTGKVVFTHQGATAALNRIGIVSHGGYFAAADCLAGVQINSVTHTKAANLMAGTVAFNANSTSPTAAVFIPRPNGTYTGKLLVAYSNGQTSNNAAGVYNLNHGLVMWDVDEPTVSSATLTNPVVVFDDTTVLFGVSAMTYDPQSSSIYVATAGEPGVVNQTTNGYGYNIERLSVAFDAATGAPTLTRITNDGKSFIKGGAKTKCISSLAVGN